MAQTRFTSRTGGVSNGAFADFNLALHVGDKPDSVNANRARLSELTGISKARTFYMNQVHGAEVFEVRASSISATTPTADALFTTEPGVALVVLTADCIPLLLSSPTAIAAVHVGRKGLVAGVLDSTLACFAQSGAAGAEITAELGAAICGDCYEVDLQTYREVTRAHPATATDEARHHLDLIAGVLAALNRVGARTLVSQDCTVHSPGYFSYRRDRVTGRQAGVIWL